MIAVVDYGRGNLFSLAQALKHVGADFEITADAGKVAVADKILLPGVGTFGDCMYHLKSRGLAEPVKAAAARGVSLLGICVGCQILLETGEEFGHQIGLGIVPGAVRRLPDPAPHDDNAIRIPNVGWRRLEIASSKGLFADTAPGTMMYFVHSFAPVPAEAAHIAATISFNGTRAAVAVQRGRVHGVQFHPEKSGPAGLALLRRFVEAT
jgi:imidazole glycerol-phosphate synthase subunit HisH